MKVLIDGDRLLPQLVFSEESSILFFIEKVTYFHQGHRMQTDMEKI